MIYIRRAILIRLIACIMLVFAMIGWFAHSAIVPEYSFGGNHQPVCKKDETLIRLKENFRFYREGDLACLKTELLEHADIAHEVYR